jgi:hypothetical protein
MNSLIGLIQYDEDGEILIDTTGMQVDDSPIGAYRSRIIREYFERLKGKRREAKDSLLADSKTLNVMIGRHQNVGRNLSQMLAELQTKQFDNFKKAFAPDLTHEERVEYARAGIEAGEDFKVFMAMERVANRNFIDIERTPLIQD